MATNLCISLVSFFTLIVLAQSKLYLDVSDHKALLTIQKDLGFRGQRSVPASPCNSTGVFCDRRISSSGYVLRISRIVLNSQKLTGFLSPAVGQLSELKELSLSNNHLFDRIPSEIVGCRKLQVLDLKNNRFSGQVPSELSSLVHLRIIDLASNKFSGNLNFLKHFPNLERLSLSDNMFTGKVPVALRSFRNLRSFNISGNNFLEGVVPELRQQPDYSSRPKRYIYAETSNGSDRAARAEAPSSISVDGAQAPSPISAGRRHKKNRNKVRGLILGFLVGAVAGFFSGFVFSILFKLFTRILRGPEDHSGIVIFSPMIKKRENLAFLEKEDGLASLEVIGKGGCGEVYKAELPDSNGKWIAIKKVKQPPKEAAEIQEEESKLLNKIMRQIKSEIQTVGHIRHRNLLPLLAHLSRPDCHYLVYEYMKNGSLQDILAGVSKGEREFDWLSRHRVAVGVASGLEYLHLNHSPRIIHRDLKPANILLDDEMEARIADFGLAKAVPDAQTHVSTTAVAGTVGYIAPEYHQTLKFTDKCDIYSFGVMLGVLVIGNLPSDEFFQHTEEMNLTKWMRNVMTSDDPKRAIDPKLMGNGYEEQMLLVLKIACFCTLDNPKERPNSKDVRCMLSQIVH